MTKFLDPKFSSRPASKEYRDNWDRTFAKTLMSESDAPDDGNTPAPQGQVWVCGACGRTSTTRYGFKDSSCVSNAVLCYDRVANARNWVAVEHTETHEQAQDVQAKEASADAAG